MKNMLLKTKRQFNCVLQLHEKQTFNNKIEHLHKGLTKQSVADMATFLLSAYRKMQKQKNKGTLT